jgi:alpha-glucosidase (family GH31 glycosyl hydrolase)
MVGPDLVVAPVVSRGATTRPRVFLPAGRWRRVVLAGREGAVGGSAVVAGPAVLRDVPAPLDELPTWRRAGGSVTRGA